MSTHASGRGGSYERTSQRHSLDDKRRSDMRCCSILAGQNDGTKRGLIEKKTSYREVAAMGRGSLSVV